MENITATLEAFNLNTSSLIRLPHSLADLHLGELKAIVESITDADIPVHDNDRVNSMTMRYAIVDAFKDGRDVISNYDLSLAQQKAINTAQKNGSLNGASSLGGVSTLSETSETASNAPKRTRNRNTYPSIKRLVENAPEASKDEIVEQAIEQLNVSDTTAVQYFYKARRELGMGTGKRGRKGSNLFPAMLELVREHGDTHDRDDIVQMAIDKGIKAGTATAYYYKAVKTLESEA